MLNLAATFVTLAAAFAYLNYRFLKLPSAIGLMLISLLLSLVATAAGLLGWEAMRDHATALMAGIDFSETLMNGMLSFLLFAGALHTNLEDLSEQKWPILSLASIGVLISTFIVGALAKGVFMVTGLQIPFIYCLLFGALISPTDPIAVLGILKQVGAPKSLETKIVGESLFNDGVGVVVFLVLLGIATGGEAVSAGHIGLLFLEEGVGGILFGLLIGGITFTMLRSVDNYSVEVLLTLALVMGGYALANALHVSGPIAMVVAGLLIGNHGRLFAMSDKTREHLDNFWELLDEGLNAVLFVMIGFEVIVVSFGAVELVAAALMVPVVLLARLCSVGLPLALLRTGRQFTRGAVWILTWGGLRGGISVALVLSMPPGAERDTLLSVTYVIVVFSILVQGLTVGPLIKRLTNT
ncbi:MAG: sodium:proton antiporter [Candidatus Thiodiazotropha sp.]|jgi:monovalent cation:H+ antiporter, CPA1 family